MIGKRIGGHEIKCDIEDNGGKWFVWLEVNRRQVLYLHLRYLPILIPFFVYKFSFYIFLDINSSTTGPLRIDRRDKEKRV